MNMKSMESTSVLSSVRWIGRDGMPLNSEEKIRILNENLQEIRDMCQNTLEDAVMMGCSEHFVRVVLSDMVATLEKPYSTRGTS